MKKADVLGVVTAAMLALGALTSSASAVPYTFNLSADPADGTFGSFSFGGSDYQTYSLSLNFSGIVELVSGDTLTANITLLSPLTVPGGSQLVGVDLITSPEATDASSSGTFNFSGLAGPGSGFINPFPGGCSNCINNIFGPSGGVDGATWSFDELVSIWTLTFSNGPLQLEGISLTYQVGNPSEVPLPAALPLFASILAGGGLIAWRKKRKAKAHSAA